MSVNLSVGAISALSRNKKGGNIVLQVLEAHKNESNRVKVVVSDGRHSHPAFLSTAHSHFYDNGSLKQFTVIKVMNAIYTVSTSEARIMITSLQPTQTLTYKLGNPVDFLTSSISQNQPSAGNQSANMGSQNQGVKVTPLRGLNPYASKWTIRCRVISKGDIRTWDKGPNNQGKLFSISLLDEEDIEIKATFFRDAVDRFYDMLDVGKVYTFSNGQIKLANKKYNNTNCDYELTFNQMAEIVPSQSASIKSVSINATPIGDLDPTNKSRSVVDVCGAVISWGSIESFTSKAGREITKLEIQLADNSNAMVRCTIFGEKCAVFEQYIRQINAEFVNLESQISPDPSKVLIVAIKAVRISDFNGCSLSLLPSSELYFSPEIKEKNTIVQWLRQGVAKGSLANRSSASGETRKAESIQERKNLHYLENLKEVDEKGEYFTVKGHLSMIRKTNLWYTACPEETNNKKVILQPDGSYFCEATGMTYSDCQHRYILNAEIADHTGSLWITIFNEDGEKLLGQTANELNQIKSSNEELFEQILLEATFEEYLFKIRVKQDVYNDEAKIRHTLVTASKINYEVENKELAEYLTQFS